MSPKWLYKRKRTQQLCFLARLAASKFQLARSSLYVKSMSQSLLMTSSLKFKVAYGVVLNFLRTRKLGGFPTFECKNLVVSIYLKNVDFSNSSMSFGIETVLMSSIKKVIFFCCWPQVRKIREIALKHQSSFLATLNSKFLCLSRKNFNFKTLAKVCIEELF